MKNTPEPDSPAQTGQPLIPPKITAAALAVMALVFAIHKWTGLPFGVLLILATATAVILAGYRIAGWVWHRADRRHGRNAHGFASAWDVHRHLSLRAVRRHTRFTHPHLPRTAAKAMKGHQIGVPIGRHRFRRIVGKVEDCYLLLAPARTVKTTWLSGVLWNWPGPAFTASTRIDIIGYTYRARQDAGQVHILNTDGLGGVPTTLRWSILDGCENPSKAITRAGHLIAASPQAEGTQNATFWRDSAALLLRIMLHAAALAGVPATTCLQWVTNPYAAEPMNTLRTHPGAYDVWAHGLTEMLAGNRETMTTIAHHAAACLQWLADPELAAVASPAPGTSLNLTEFLLNNGTIYMIGGDRPHASLAPYVACLAAEIFDTAKQVASRQPGHRLASKLLMALDEAPIIAPVPLDKWSAEAGGWGITLIAASQTAAALYERWGDRGGQTIISNAGVLIIGPGFKDPAASEDLSRLCGTYGRTASPDDPDSRSARVLSPERIRLIGWPRAVVLARSTRPLILRLNLIGDIKGHLPAGHIYVPDHAAVHDDAAEIATVTKLPSRVA